MHLTVGISVRRRQARSACYAAPQTRVLVAPPPRICLMTTDSTDQGDSTDSARPDDLGGLGPGIRIPARSLDLLINRLEVDPRWSVHALGDMLAATTAPATATALLGLLLERFPERPEPEAVRRALWSMVVENRSQVFDEPPTPEMTFGLTPLADATDVARWLGLTVGELEWFADRGHWLLSKKTALVHYRYVTIPKRDGVRVIEAPKPHLREIQRRILREILDRIPPHRAAQGFVAGRSTASFGWPHSDRNVVLRVDLRNCFPTITSARVRAVFAAAGYRRTARLLSEICTTATPPDVLRGLDFAHASLLRGRHLPQGAPTSPALANLVMRTMDRRIWAYARHNNLHYSRYAMIWPSRATSWTPGRCSGRCCASSPTKASPFTRTRRRSCTRTSGSNSRGSWSTTGPGSAGSTTTTSGHCCTTPFARGRTPRTATAIRVSASMCTAGSPGSQPPAQPGETRCWPWPNGLIGIASPWPAGAARSAACLYRPTATSLGR